MLQGLCAKVLQAGLLDPKPGDCGDALPVEGDAGTVDGKSARLLQKAISKWQNATATKRQELLNELRARLDEATDPGASEPQEILSSVLRGLVGAMSAPASQKQGAAKDDCPGGGNQS